jgi:hypothetical protein
MIPFQPTEESMVVYTCHPSYAGSMNSRMAVHTGLGINVRPYLKNKAKMNGSGGRVTAWQVQDPILPPC